METVKQIDIENRIYYFHSDIIDLKNLNVRLSKVGKKIMQKHWYLQYSIYYN